MADNQRAVGYLDLNIQGFQDALATAKKLLVAFTAALAAIKTVDFWKDGIKDAIDFGNAAYFAAQKINGYDPGQLYLVQKALEAGGLAADEARQKISDFALSGRPLEQMFKGGGAAFADALNRAAAAYGTQAEVLSRSAEKLAYVREQLNTLGEKLRGFFLGLVDQIAQPLSNLLAEINKIDLVGMGERFGAYIKDAVNTVRGLLQGGNLLSTLGTGLKLAFQTAGIYLVGAAQTFLNSLTKSDVWANLGSLLINSLAVVGSYLTKLFLEIGKLLVATIQAGIATLAKQHPEIAKLLGVETRSPEEQAKEARTKSLEGQFKLADFFEKQGAKITAGQIRENAVAASNLKYQETLYSARQNGGLSTNIAENYKGINQTDTIKGTDQLVSGILSASKEGSAKAAQALSQTKIDFKLPPADKIYPGYTDDLKAFNEALEKARKTGENLPQQPMTKNALFSEKADPYHVIADSLAKVGGGGRYVRTGLSIAEKAAMDSLLVQKQIAANTAVIAKNSHGTPPVNNVRGG